MFPGMTRRRRTWTWAATRGNSRSKAEYHERLDWVFELFPRLAERRTQVGGTLSGGEQQMLAIGRALMARPKLLLLDEPSMGLAPMVIAADLPDHLRDQPQGTTVLLVEQNAQQALTRTDRAYILETGEITVEGGGRDLLADPAFAPPTSASPELNTSRRQARRHGRRTRRSCSVRS